MNFEVPILLYDDSFDLGLEKLKIWLTEENLYHIVLLIWLEKEIPV